MIRKRKPIGQLILLISIFFSCSGNQIGNAQREPSEPFSIAFSPSKSLFRIGDTITFTVLNLALSDSVYYEFSFGQKLAIGNKTVVSISSSEFPVGHHSIKAKNRSGASASLSFTLLPNYEPAKLTYSIVETYPHSIASYTQGLVFDKGHLLESTGLYGESKLMKVDIPSGESLQTHVLENTVFGEGLAMAGSKLYQLTYQSKKGFIYNKENFEQIGEFSYPSEGWGLCFDGKDLLMTDGSHFIYTIDTASMHIVKQMPVFDYFGPVYRLNELEWVNGDLYANVYMTNKIVKINPKTGEVIGNLNCSQLLQAKHRHPAIDVLNGIAYNCETGNFYITGKKWPVLFEIKIEEEE